MSKNVVEPSKLQMAIWRRIACWISKAIRAQEHARTHAPTITHPHPHKHTHEHARTHARTRKHTEICSADWFRERVSMLRYKYLFLAPLCLKLSKGWLIPHIRPPTACRKIFTIPKLIQTRNGSSALSLQKKRAYVSKRRIFSVTSSL